MFYLNRCNRSGIIHDAGLIGGLKQNGKWKMDARFPRRELICRIEQLAAKRHCITLRNWDAERFITEHIPLLPKGSLVYCDPPYFHKADRLYPNHYAPEDHERIATIIQTRLLRPWIISYDCTPEILSFYGERRKFWYSLQYSAAKVYKGKELVVVSDRLQLPKKSVLPFIDKGLKRR